MYLGEATVGGMAFVFVNNRHYLKIKGGASSSMVTGLVCRWGLVAPFLLKRGRPENRPDIIKKVALYTALRARYAT